MCSITALLGLTESVESHRDAVLRASSLQHHRGPDWSGVIQTSTAVIAHERLAIVDVASGSQPLVDPETGTILAVNGEIYNHRALKKSTLASYPFTTGSDCEVMLGLYREHGADLVLHLEGMYAFVLHEPDTGAWLVGRDPIGIIPLYFGRDDEGQTWVASEMKAISDICTEVQTFPPGHTLSNMDFAPVNRYQRDWMTWDQHPREPYLPEALHKALDESVQSHLMGDVPYGLLISGGLDSSVVAALAMRHAQQRIDEDKTTQAWWPNVHSFAIGLEGSPDLAAAEEVAAFIGTTHHGMTYTIQEGMDALSDVIRHIETYDVTTIRASTPMYLMARRIRTMGIKMVLSGEGADELFGGYLYFHLAPDAREFHEETVRKVLDLHKYDCARANKSMMAWGIEARVPFLDRNFIDHAMRLDPVCKMAGPGKLEKEPLRKAFEGLLPERILRRQKEQFSDGVGYGWIDSLKAQADLRVSDTDLNRAASRFPINPPTTKEGYWYREMFERHFPSAAAASTVPGGKSVACSTEKALEWDARLRNVVDPSGRAVTQVHQDGYSAPHADDPSPKQG
ncbi:MAG: asparagine synthase B [Bacteroidetes bacterium]|nr:asparagine synthase B [Bacteroidota bacterium]MDA0903978.1 asparagine synthase B [Bacteroidota bacterium]MDA1243158.1 asparagine synthase B [Bacteroidota bacterium]